MIFAVIFRFVSAAVSRTWVDRAARKVTQVADTPDSTLDAAQTSINGLVLTNATATGVVATYAYDDLGRPVEARTDSDGGARSVRQTTQYNERGQVAWTEDGANHRTAFAYDTAGRQSAVTNALGQVTTTLYDALGNVTNVTGAAYPVSYGYDAWNRMVWMKTYRDENGAGDLTQWQHDLATGLVTNKVYADGKGTAYAYTSDGKLSRRTWARGTATDYGYTNAGELSSVDYSDATPDVTYTHDRLGRVVEAMTAGVCTNAYSYDVATLARSGETRRSIFGPTETLVRQQDVLGRPAGLMLGNDYAVGYGYDAVGRFGTVASTNTANAVTGQWTYERVPGSDLVAGWTAAAGNYWRRSYEAQRDLIAETHSGHGATVLDSYAYTNDALGRRTARVDAGVTTNAFGYNLRSEVISAMMGSDQFGYGYDPIGNRLTATNNTAVTTYFANELNQYTNIVNGASAEPTYDDDGNMLAFGNGWTATWDGENRLVQLTKDGQQIGYAYDHQSRRISKQTAAGVEVFSYDDWAMIRHTAPGGAKTDYIYGLDLSGTPQGAGTVGSLLGMVRAGDTAPICYGYDANGNVTQLADGSGAVAARYAYDPFGNTLTSSGPLAAINPFRFSTKYHEAETGLYYYGYRMYAPVIGRFVSRDPLGEASFAAAYFVRQYGEVISHLERTEMSAARGVLAKELAVKKMVLIKEGLRHSYRFVNNAPANQVDPEGLRCKQEVWSDGYRVHGNWCGPGWTAGRRIRASDFDWWTYPFPQPVDGLDNCCLVHDACHAGINLNDPVDMRLRNLDPDLAQCDRALCECARWADSTSRVARRCIVCAMCHAIPFGRGIGIY